MMKFVPREIKTELEACGIPFRLEMGRRHIKIFIGPKFAGILPSSGTSESNRRATLNIRAQVRRAIEEVKNG